MANRKMKNEKDYLEMLRRILDEGFYRKPVDEEGRYELFAQPLRFDLTENKIPLMTTKKVFFRSLAIETGSSADVWSPWTDEEV
jgi:thymidylate synthase